MSARALAQRIASGEWRLNQALPSEGDLARAYGLSVGTVRKALEKVPGVESAKVDLKTHRAIVSFDPSKATPELLTKATADAGFPSSVLQLQ